MGQIGTTSQLSLLGLTAQAEARLARPCPTSAVGGQSLSPRPTTLCKTAWKKGEGPR
jgi:hypothetical protein